MDSNILEANQINDKLFGGQELWGKKKTERVKVCSNL